MVHHHARRVSLSHLASAVAPLEHQVEHFLKSLIATVLSCEVSLRASVHTEPTHVQPLLHLPSSIINTQKSIAAEASPTCHPQKRTNVNHHAGCITCMLLAPSPTHRSLSPETRSIYSV